MSPHAASDSASRPAGASEIRSARRGLTHAPTRPSDAPPGWPEARRPTVGAEGAFGARKNRVSPPATAAAPTPNAIVEAVAAPWASCPSCSPCWLQYLSAVQSLPSAVFSLFIAMTPNTAPMPMPTTPAPVTTRPMMRCVEPGLALPASPPVPSPLPVSTASSGTDTVRLPPAPATSIDW